MGAAVSITRALNLTAFGASQGGGSGEKDGAAARRILALALVLDGLDRKMAAETCGMNRQTLRDWVHRYNAEGTGRATPISNRQAPDRSSRRGRQAELGRACRGPATDPARHGVGALAADRSARRIASGASVSRSTSVSVGKVLAKLGLTAGCR